MPADVSSSDLLRRLERLEDEHAIAATLRQYLRGIDEHDQQVFLGCFTEDAVYRIWYPGREDFDPPVVGHEQLAKFLVVVAAAARQRPVPGQHHTLSVEAEIDGDRARVHSSFFTFGQVPSPGPSPSVGLTSYGRYDDDLRRGEDGRWRIAVRNVHCQVLAKRQDYQARDPA
jgi:hypothetical protein